MARGGLKNSIPAISVDTVRGRRKGDRTRRMDRGKGGKKKKGEKERWKWKVGKREKGEKERYLTRQVARRIQFFNLFKSFN